ncbi:hypothetical protein SAMN05192562_1122 [Kosakonia arachidis]|uniref:Uncharacterized protein n=1 Tax=Kosakonia arachidis TaxID=551989 RepID=A0A1I7E813_9ENTR|nr:hypothetical protein SAMN05192562_1122 [Kosakonia arachidis]
MCNVSPEGTAKLRYADNWYPQSIDLDLDVWVQVSNISTIFLTATATSNTPPTITCDYQANGVTKRVWDITLKPSCTSTVNDSAMGNLNPGTSDHHIGVSGTSNGTVRFTSPDMDSSGVLHLGGSADVLVQPDANHISTSPVSWTTPSDSTLNTHVTVNTKAKAGPLSSVLTATLTCQ